MVTIGTRLGPKTGFSGESKTKRRETGGLAIKIVQIITHMDTVGGAQVHVRDIAIGLKKSGHEIYLIAGGNENVHEVLENDGIQIIYSQNLIHKLNIFSDIKAILEIRRIVKEIKPDIIAIHSSKAGIIGRISGWSLRIPTIFTAHGWSYTDGVPKKKQRFYILFEKAVGRISDGVIAVSEYDKQLAIRHRVLPEGKVRTIHNGVHDIVSQNKAVYSDEHPKIIMVARFAQPKKQLQLLKALNQLRHIQWNMYFAGEGPKLQEAQDYAENTGLSDRVYFLGNRKDVTELLHQSDLFALMSDWEGLPLSILEAMRCGLPIIASDVGGVNEAVRQSKNGYLIPKNDSKELVDKLTMLLTKPALRLEMGNSGRKLYEDNFTFEKMHKETFSYYEKVIKSK